MLTADDRKTWISTTVPVAARLRLRCDLSVRSILDGAWWPRSREPVSELTALIAALDPRHPPVTSVMLNGQAWDSHPRRIRVAGRLVRLGWFTSLDPCLLIATTSNDQRVDLLVVPPDASRATANAAMDMAAEGAPTLRAAAIMASDATRPSDQPRAEADWESEGGLVAGHQSRRVAVNTAATGPAPAPVR
jgi:Family of unknown function (DUF5994)